MNHRFEIQKPLPEIGSRIRSVFFMVKDKVNWVLNDQRRGCIYCICPGGPKGPEAVQMLILSTIMSKIQYQPAKIPNLAPKIPNTDMIRRSPRSKSC